MKLIRILPFFLLSYATLAAELTSACKGPLLAPPGYYQTVVIRSHNQYHCPTFPKPFTNSLNFPSKYQGSDSARATLNVDSDKAYRAAVDSIRDFEKLSANLASDYIRGKGVEARNCLLNLLYSWADADALLYKPDQDNHVGQAVRKWALATSAAAYLEIVQLNSDLPPLDTKKRETIEEWFADLTVPIIDYYSDRDPRKINNHDYWAAWAVMLAAVNLQDCKKFQWALTKFREGSQQVDGQGLLANEIRRKARALNYQNFALQPLVMLATFAKANNQLKPEDEKALRRLVKAVVEGIDDPQLYRVLTGEEQEMDGVITGWSLAWTQPWRFYFEDESLAFLDTLSLKAFKSTRLGGDLQWLFANEVSTQSDPAIKPQSPIVNNK